jgi:Ribonucleotide reductase, barrel domain/Ribonucleotide reductase, all-alpha domain
MWGITFWTLVYVHVLLRMSIPVVALQDPSYCRPSSKTFRGGSLEARPKQIHDQIRAEVSRDPELDDETVYMINQDGDLEILDDNAVRLGALTLLLALVLLLDLMDTCACFTKILRYLQARSSGLDKSYLNFPALAETIRKGTYPNIKFADLATLSAETAASLSTQHPDYARLAARILIDQNHKQTPSTFSEAITLLYDNGNGFIHKDLAELVTRRREEINDRIVSERDIQLLTYFGFKTLEKSYLLRSNHDTPIERPQYLFMRVALGIHCCSVNSTDDKNLTEEERLAAAFETYDLLSQGYFSHASPTLFHSGTTHPQLCSCFLVQMSDDSIQGIYDTLSQCARISKAAGGIGLSVHNIRARGTEIKGTRGTSNGLVPMLRVYDVTARYVDQGGGKRPGAFAIYIEPWHSDVESFLMMKRNHGKEEQRARDLFYALWIPDLFMKRVEEDGVWSLMCPHICPGLSEVYGEEFDELYQKYEGEGRYVRQIRARDLWSAIVEAQIETGTPYMLYKDAANRKSNQQNLGTIQSSNLCCEIVQVREINGVMNEDGCSFKAIIDSHRNAAVHEQERSRCLQPGQPVRTLLFVGFFCFHIHAPSTHRCYLPV